MRVKLPIYEKALMDVTRLVRRARFNLKSGRADSILPETWTREQVEQERCRRLSELLLDAAQRFPFWNSRLRSCGVLDAEEKIDLTRFTNLPPLERADLVERCDELADEDYPDQTWWDETGGSTGEPVRILKDRNSKQSMLRAKEQMHGWAGHKLGMTMLELWGAERDILEQRERPPFWEWPLRQRLRCKKLVQNAFRMGEEEMRQYLAEWHWYRPHGVLAYAHSIHELAKFAEREGIEPFQPRAIITTAGTLTSDMRADIRRVFGAPVFNRYGSREFGNMAMNCEHEDGLHVISTATMIEILRADGTPAEPGELGEIVVTSLTARAMPLIRYRIGDLATMSPNACACGRNTPLLSEIKGRTNDQFVRIDGGFCSGDYFPHMMKNVNGVKKYQVIQEELDLIRFVSIVTENYDKDDAEKYLTEITKKAIGRSCQLIFDYPNEIQTNATGKHRFTVSHVKGAWQK